LFSYAESKSLPELVGPAVAVLQSLLDQERDVSTFLALAAEQFDEGREKTMSPSKNT
jgi:hypothetical protein